MIQLRNIKSIDKLFELVDNCKGDVYVCSAEGDKMNLKSKFCRIVLLSKIFKLEDIQELQLDVEDRDDTLMFLNFMLEGN